MSLSATFKDDEGEVIDVSSSTVMVFILKKPSGTILTVDAEFSDTGSDGVIQYATQSGDLDQLGRWQYQGRVVYDDGVRHTQMKGFTVRQVLE